MRKKNQGKIQTVCCEYNNSEKQEKQRRNYINHFLKSKHPIDKTVQVDQFLGKCKVFHRQRIVFLHYLGVASAPSVPLFHQILEIFRRKPERQRLSYEKALIAFILYKHSGGHVFGNGTCGNAAYPVYCSSPEKSVSSHMKYSIEMSPFFLHCSHKKILFIWDIRTYTKIILKWVHVVEYLGGLHKSRGFIFKVIQHN